MRAIRQVFKICLMLFAFTGLTQVTAQGIDPKITNNRAFTHPQTHVVLVGADVRLPSDGIWVIDEQPVVGLTDISLEAPELILQRSMGLKELKNKERRERNKGRYIFDRIYRQLEIYARKNNGVSHADQNLLLAKNRFKSGELENIFLMPATTILEQNDKKRWRRVKERDVVLAVELNPLHDDGKHWVLYTNGRTKLVSIDAKFVKQHQLSITAQKASLEQRLAEIAVSADYKLAARITDKNQKKGVSTLQLRNLENGKKLTIKWQPSTSATADAELQKVWAKQRLAKWESMLEHGNVGYLPYWLEASYRQYDLEKSDVVEPRSRRFRRRANNNRTANLMGILGGRAAIRETLQMQQLAVLKRKSKVKEVSIDSIKGVEVKSHPFAEMLAKSPLTNQGKKLDLADVTPSDRFFAWFSRPEDFNQYLNGGSEFIFNAGATLSGKNNKHHLKQRYLKQLGVSSDFAKRFLASGAVSEMAVVLPDLFLQDGTDITLVMKLVQADAAKSLLSVLKINVAEGIQTMQVAGGTSYWSLQEDLLIVSTHQDEIQRVVQLASGDRSTSLGQSAEFKYMLTQLPVEQKSHAYFYFSDPFIRRLVGPKVKIAQLRRQIARTEMESLAAANLHYRVDGHMIPATGISEKALMERGYLQQPLVALDREMQADGSVTSEKWGTPANLKTLLSNPVELVNRSEKQAYDRYLQGYNRFWRRFFDPIAIRLNHEESNQLEVSTFILPLIDNSIYQQFRDMLISDEKAKTLSIPQLTPEPVAQLSLNLNDKLWAQGNQELVQKSLFKLTGLPPRIGDYFGPDIHLALGDGDPIIIMGSGGLSGAFGVFDGSRRANQALFLPVIGSLLTRPSVLMIGLKDAAAVKQLLHSMAEGPFAKNPLRGIGEGKFYGIAGKDAWRYEMDIEGIIGMRFGIEIKDRYLLISNQPMSYNPNLSSSKTSLNNGAAMSLSPKAAVKQRPALYASASTQQQKAALAGINVLYPYMLAGADTVEEALLQAQKQLGYLPQHPGIGEWQWQDGKLSSTVFGDYQRQYLTEYNKDESFGMLQKVDRIKMNMQFEDDGLRAQLRWQLNQ